MKNAMCLVAFLLSCVGCGSDLPVGGQDGVDAVVSQDANGSLDGAMGNDVVKADVEHVKPECAGMVDCNDGNVCTFDACEKGKCIHAELADKAACDDGDPCTTGICKAGTCFQNKTEGTDGVHGCVLCKSNSDCPAQIGYAHYCKGDQQQDEKLHGCIAGVCQWGVSSFTCDAGCDSVTGMCKSECSGDSDCDDKVACTADICTSAHKCSHIPADNLCGDGKFCIIQENGNTLPSGCYECKGNMGECNDGNSCTDDTCVAGKCEHPAVDNNLVPIGCDVDADACTIDYCSDGMCKSMAVGQTKCPSCKTDQDCSPYAGPYCSEDGKFAFWTEMSTCEIVVKEPVLGTCKFAVSKKTPCPNGCKWPQGKEPLKCE